jgi:hypothetical protein
MIWLHCIIKTAKIQFNTAILSCNGGINRKNGGINPDFASIKMRNPKPANGLGYKSPK